ncbi:MULTISPECIES: glycoside hydrolase family 65 protein [unclassified Leeuwenhoekiella]|uniref:glycoside hydrolase family 65 protein n=1 Tax=unclassified Leeuwenhoekiella TaxID=2615029 RepID=UPI000C559A95|nr:MULTISPECIES: glycoside hydrolase family 65 protein [unclassified Leeuwenhoekiella]MBA80502.1 family 65 glycosyl hydrolase [Leeuwenhoekiella sp.]|tara:strand:- start:102159 stop:104465 length:2307 start_codon:yes stop_codon:yes gene_type:complete
MNQDYIVPAPWAIIEEGFEKDRVKSSESLFSIGNGAMGQRANFEEEYSGKTFQGSYIGGVYYPDKTRVGWWKNGYPEYFAKVLNAPSWIGIKVTIDGESLDLNTAKSVSNFRRELNMKEGWLGRSFEAELQNGVKVKVQSKRFLSLEHDEIGAINYEVTPLNKDVSISYEPYLDSGITNEDTNWDDKFWNTLSVEEEGNKAYITAHTMKTFFYVCTAMTNTFTVDGKEISLTLSTNMTDTYIGHVYETDIREGETFAIQKYAGYTTSFNHDQNELKQAAEKVLNTALETGFDKLLARQKEDWAEIWSMADIVIDGDVRAQQGIRFNIFHLNQTYLGKDSRLNIGPKGFTGEKYGGSTYWDTEAYCLHFYMATKNQDVARSLLTYRYNHLPKAIENAGKLGFKDGAALYPMVTMNGEECHNEWEITFEEIHRNGAMIFAIRDYVKYTGDYSYIPEKGLEVIIGVARFWKQRATWSAKKEQYVILGVTGPNEYENNVNNNFYTNYLAKWCLEYAVEHCKNVAQEFGSDYKRISGQTELKEEELKSWAEVAEKMYLPYSEEQGVYLQQDSFLDKELVTVADLSKSERPINQKWSWDRILRSPYIKQADTLQAFYVFEEDFSDDQLKKHFDFYEPFTVHESSLSPCVHAIQAAKLGQMDQAYEFYLRTSRLDLDDYNKEVHEGLHITSMAGTWMSVVEGFGGMRIKDNTLSFDPKMPEAWDGFSFKLNYRNQILKVAVGKNKTVFTLNDGEDLTLLINGKKVTVKGGSSVEV